METKNGLPCENCESIKASMEIGYKPKWSVRIVENGDYQILYPSYSEFWKQEVQITRKVSRETVVHLLKDIQIALGI